eukprot:gene31017-37487_t
MYSGLSKFDLCFAESLQGTFNIIEVPADLAKLVENGESIELKGGDKDEAVLCTSSQTYSMKRAEISNSVFLSPSVGLEEGSRLTLTATVKDYFELRKADGKASKLKDIVLSMQHADTVQRLPFDELYAQIPASRAEINAAASQLGLVAHEDSYFFLSKSAYVKNLRVLFGALLSGGASIERLVFSDLYAQLSSDMAEDTLRYLLLSLGRVEDAEAWRLDALQVARAVALCVLFPDQVLAASVFYVEWCALAPLQLADLASLLDLVKDQVVVSPQAKGEGTVQLRSV